MPPNKVKNKKVKKKVKKKVAKKAIKKAVKKAVKKKVVGKVAKKDDPLVRPTLKFIIEQADIFWDKAGHMTQFPTKVSYIAYLKDFYNTHIAKMSDPEYAQFVEEQQRQTIERLKKMEAYMVERLGNQKGGTA